jgi:hypothetical protein
VIYSSLSSIRRDYTPIIPIVVLYLASFLYINPILSSSVQRRDLWCSCEERKKELVALNKNNDSEIAQLLSPIEANTFFFPDNVYLRMPFYWYPWFGDAAWYLCEHKTYLFAPQEINNKKIYYYFPFLTEEINIAPENRSPYPRHSSSKKFHCCDISSAVEALPQWIIVRTEPDKQKDIHALYFAAHFIFACNTCNVKEIVGMIRWLNKEQRENFLTKANRFLSEKGKETLHKTLDAIGYREKKGAFVVVHNKDTTTLSIIVVAISSIFIMKILLLWHSGYIEGMIYNDIL